MFNEIKHKALGVDIFSLLGNIKDRIKLEYYKIFF